MTYIDEIALRIYRKTLSGPQAQRQEPNDLYWPLYRIYAVLCLAKGSLTSLEDVHDAWSAWQAGWDATHRSLIRFKDLSPETQELDRIFRNAIAEVAMERFAEDTS